MKMWEVTGYNNKSIFPFTARVSEGSLEDFVIKYEIRALTKISMKEIYEGEK